MKEKQENTKNKKQNKYCTNCDKIAKKERKKTVLISILSMIIVISLLFSFMYSPYTSQKLTQSLHFVTDDYYSSVATEFENDEIVKSVSFLCSQFDNPEEQLVCVNDFTRRFFNYDKSMVGIKPIRYPSELINEGGCCRDYSIFYKAVIDSMGFETLFIFEPNHVYLVIYSGVEIYALDQESLFLLNDYDKEQLGLTIIEMKEIEPLYINIDDINNPNATIYEKDEWLQ